MKTVKYLAMRESADGSRVEILSVTREMDARGKCKSMTEDVIETYPNTPTGLRGAHERVRNANRKYSLSSSLMAASHERA